jgi:ABC-type amino acid transport substrate-binding protein
MRVWSLRRRTLILAGLGLLVAVGVLAGLLAGGALAARDRTWERVRAEKLLRVGLDASFPPFEMLDPSSGQIVGLDVDLATALAAELGEGIHPQIMNIGFDGLYDSLLAGRIDAIISALPVDYAWTEDVRYSQPYFEAGLVIVTRSELASQMAGPDDLAGRRIGVEWGSEGDAYVRQLSRRLPGVTTQSYPGPAEALAAAGAGEVDAVLVDAVSAYQELRRQPGLAIVGAPLTQVSYAVAVRRTSPVLGRQLDAALARLKQRGELEAILKRWL